RVRDDDDADVASLDPRVSRPPELALSRSHHLAHLRVPGDDRDGGVDLRLADAGRHVLPGDLDRVRVTERDLMRLRERLEPWPVVERDALVQREPRERAVHRAGVEARA